MKASTRWLITAAFAVWGARSARAAEVKIISNQSVTADTISAGELKSVFLLQKRALQDGSIVAPVVQKSGATQELFLKEYLDRNPEEVRAYYYGLVYTGKGLMPKELHSDAEVVAYVARTRGAIGYVSSAASSEGVKILAVVRQGHEPERRLLKRVEPEYPETLKRLHISGTVRLQLTISPKGNVDDVSVLGGNPILGEAAAKAAQQWVYAAAARRSTVEVSVPFELAP
ncbi:MAG TPA: TonB family protein [Candidatus Dormibacteraeota bacterium]|nr:TonB family protein [Candidatus Dormibacteraeota bacterium]